MPLRSIVTDEPSATGPPAAGECGFGEGEAGQVDPPYGRNIHNDGAPSLQARESSRAAGSAAPLTIRLVSTSLAHGTAPQRDDEHWHDLHPYHRSGDSSASCERIEAAAQSKSRVFRCEGEYWEIRYTGECIRIRSMKGLFYLRHLLQHPGEHVHVSRLSALGDHYAGNAKAAGSSEERGLDVPPEAPLVTNDVGTVIDYRATWEYRARLNELRAELDEASQWADFGRAASIQREIDFIQNEIGSAYGINGQPRKLDDQTERTRKAVTNRIHDGIVRIANQSPTLGRHLRNAIRTGMFCRYSPESSVSWEF
jgi:hypothetical protein